jgi:hypothetical protein
VVVVASDARLFADEYLGPIVDQERRGRHKTSDIEHLLIEMFRRLHLVPIPDLPNQKAFAAKLTRWWNENPDRPKRGRLGSQLRQACMVGVEERAEGLAVIHT